MKLGLRFEPKAAPILQYLADRVRNGELGPHTSVNTFEQARVAAATGEPLEVICNDPREVVVMAALYVRLGVPQPVIEELSGG